MDAPAKLNLFLEVMGRRDDGMHEIVSVLQTVSLVDTIRLAPSSAGPPELSCDSPSVGPPAENLALRAAELVQEVAGGRGGVRIRLEKAIPTGAGLGGGSSDGAAVLRELNRLWDAGCDDKRLRELATRLGADVPFFVTGGTALVRGAGERVEPVARTHTVWYVLAVPRARASTREVYVALDRRDLRDPRRGCEEVLDVLTRGSPKALGEALFNRLEGPASRLIPEISSLRERLLQAGCLGAAMTGSGAGVFGVTAGERHAVDCAQRLEDADDSLRVFVVHSLARQPAPP